MLALRRSILLEILLAASAICLGLGVSLPVVKLTWLYFWSDTHSILSVLWYLFQSDEIFLSAILFVFSVLFPVAKILFLLVVYVRHVMGLRPRLANLKYLSWFGKWSMLDVLVLALVVFYTKQSGVADATTLPGMYFFAAAVMLTMWASGTLEQQLTEAERDIPHRQRQNSGVSGHTGQDN